MGRERRKIIKSLIQLVYFMRGSIQYDSMKNMTMMERQEVGTFVEERLENEGKKAYPNY